jgi:hypothetical protein
MSLLCVYDNINPKLIKQYICYYDVIHIFHHIIPISDIFFLRAAVKFLHRFVISCDKFKCDNLIIYTI